MAFAKKPRGDAQHLVSQGVIASRESLLGCVLSTDQLVVTRLTPVTSVTERDEIDTAEEGGFS